ncbi:MAG TPA: hypothetical protein VF790_03470 [Dissulfurispiraceae bacterium]
MIHVQDYAGVLENLGQEYSVAAVRYVPNLKTWANEHGVTLHEPGQPMKLVVDREGLLVMVAQFDVSEEVLGGIIKGLDVRWQVVDNRANLALRFDSIEEMLVYCFLKECASADRDLSGNDLLEDEWVIREMERLGYFAGEVSG